jgi:hypothetical protein
MRRALLAPLSALVLTACAGAPPEVAFPPSPPPAPTSPAAPATSAPAAPSADPFAVKGPLREEPLLRAPDLEGVTGTLPPAPAGLEPAPALCTAFVKRKPAAGVSCAVKQAPDGSLAPLAAALAETDAAKRDAALAALEGCVDLLPGVVRAIRAELAPTECGDALVLPVLDKPPAKMGGAVRTALLGLGFAARLARATGTPPVAPKPLDRPKLKAFLKGPMRMWLDGAARSLQSLSAEGSKLPYYGKALVAIEAGLAEMRMVDAVRSAPLPDDLAKDAEFKDIYYAALDEALDPRKTRGRDAALVGLGIFAYMGAIDDPRVAKARALIGKLYGGRRIDALDAITLPKLAPAELGSTTAKLAAQLPTYYASLLLPGDAARDPKILRVLADRGVSVPHRAALAEPGLPASDLRLYARARIALGQRYWRALDFDQATALLVAANQAEPTDEGRFLLALALALRDGPEDASAMLLRAPVVSLGIGSTAALDSVAAGATPFAPLAAFDAALIRQVAPPVNADAAYWDDVAKRWSDAAARIEDGASKSFAADRAKAAEATAAAIR